MTWRVARALDVLLDEINTAAPWRSRISDGSIGDAAHATRTSDHNPWVVLGGVGIVRARDFTHDPGGGLDCQDLASELEVLLHRGTHPALGSGAYIIWRRRILSRDRLGEGWRPYYGSNPHEAHLHLSVATAAAGFDSMTPWGVLTEGIDMAEGLSGDDVERIARAVWNRELLAEGGDMVRAGRILVATHRRANTGPRLRAIEAGLEDLERDAGEHATRGQAKRLRELTRELLDDVTELQLQHSEEG